MHKPQIPSIHIIFKTIKYHKSITATFPELGARLGKQLIRLLESHALLWEKNEADEVDYQFVLRVAVDSVPVLRVEAIRLLLEGEKTGKDLSAHLQKGKSTIGYIKQDLQMLGVVEKVASGKGWKIIESFEEDLYTT